MAYKSKNLSIGKARLQGAKTNTLSALNDAINSQAEFNRGLKDMQKNQMARNKMGQNLSQLYTMSQYSDFSKRLAKDEYAKYKTNFMSMVGKEGIEDYTFPTEDEWYKSRPYGTIGGVDYTPSDVSMNFDDMDVEKLNRLMRIGYGK